MASRILMKIFSYHKDDQPMRNTNSNNDLNNIKNIKKYLSNEYRKVINDISEIIQFVARIDD